MLGVIGRWIDSWIDPYNSDRRKALGVVKPARWIWHRLPWPLNSVAYGLVLIGATLIWFIEDALPIM
jgi:hypothetical protein